ncbi:MAG: GH32 C-terminal domain-containing protein, partial [Clostridia bacterium]|nr:GH32 C-terminal domain-containing protein [Clostridia bacterium]
VYNEETGTVTQTQCLASSEDAIHFEKHPANPVISIQQLPEGFSPSDFRDPRVFERNGSYFLVVGSEDESGAGAVLLYKSVDLKNWEFVNVLQKSDGTIGRKTWECPDLFELGGKDILIFSPQHMKPRGYAYHNLHASVYEVGQLDTARGLFEGGEPQPLDYGFDFYAPQVLVDASGRRIMTAWMDMWQSPMPTASLDHYWAGAMILPRELNLRDGKLSFSPVREIERYRGRVFALRQQMLLGQHILPVEGDCFELEAVFNFYSGSKARLPKQAKDEDDFNRTLSLGIMLRVGNDEHTTVKLDKDHHKGEGVLTLDRTHSGAGPGGIRQAPVCLKEGRLKLRIFVDKSSVEVFINDGETVMTARIYPQQASRGIVLFSDGVCELEALNKWDLMREDE